MLNREQTKKLSIVEEFLRVNEFSQVEVKESVEAHVEDETSKEDPCAFMK